MTQRILQTGSGESCGLKIKDCLLFAEEHVVYLPAELIFFIIKAMNVNYSKIDIHWKL